MLTDSQRDAHWQVVGGSAAPAVVGVDPYLTAYRLARQYLYPEERPNLGDNEAVYWGSALEDTIARAAAERNGWKLKRVNRQLRRGWLGGFPDRLIVGINEGLEIKNRNAWKMDEYRDGPLMVEIVQCHVYMALTGYSRWWLAALVGGQKLLIFPIDRDETLINGIETACQAFGERVISRRELPEPETADDLIAAYPKATAEKSIEVYPESDIALTVDELRGTKAYIAKLEMECEALEARIKAGMADAESLKTAGRKLCTWKNQTSQRLDTAALKAELPDVAARYLKETQSRVFRLAKETAK
jgi:predicted phage-related endonuclease